MTHQLQLDRLRPVRWTRRAEALLSRLDLDLGEIVTGLRSKRGFYGLCALFWCALQERDHGFAEPADLAEYLGTPAQQLAAMRLVEAMLQEAGYLRLAEKKSELNATTTSPSGRSMSSNSDLAATASTGRT